ncbi:ABC transporter permease [Aminobacter sp. SR38]|uniref:ABC transporter permease n=1 Tax=Aminobacter sp. SR38 TaxID=2774562 RepID=UPI002111726B|nr:ABC transporter permease [Aminobacter sp. SR38]
MSCQCISSAAMVFLCQGLTALIAAQQGWTNHPVEGLNVVPLGPLANIPVIGAIFFRQDIVVYLMLPIFTLVSWGLGRSMIGLRLRAVGSPEAADAAGISIPLYRYGAVLVGAALVGLAGGYLSVGVAKIWVDGMAGGRGWIAIALVIFARWQPGRALLGAVLFGCVEAMLPRIAAVGVQVPQYFVLMTPYIATLGVMIWSSLKMNVRHAEPMALGQPHAREERR